LELQILFYRDGMVRFRTNPKVNQRRNIFEQIVQVSEITRNNAVPPVLILQLKSIRFKINNQSFMIHYMSYEIIIHVLL